MNKKIIISLIAVLLISGGVFAMKSKKPLTPGSQTDNQLMGEAAEFAKAIESGRPTTCTLTKGGDGVEYHFKDQKMVANITTIVDSNTTLSHMINDQEYIYMWVDGQKQGTKMSLAVPSPSPDEYTQNETVPQFDSADDYDLLQNDGYAIDCQPGNFNDSVFTPPATIEFMDPTEIMKTIPSPGSTGEYNMSQLQELQKQYGGITIPEDQ